VNSGANNGLAARKRRNLRRLAVIAGHSIIRAFIGSSSSEKKSSAPGLHRKFAGASLEPLRLKDKVGCL
jgi:hypothetical protein